MQAHASSDGFRTLYRHYLPRVFGYIAHRVGTREDAEDLTAEVFTRALAALADFEFRGSESLTAWLFRITYHAVIAHYRQRGRRQIIDVPLPDASDEWLAQKVYRAAENLREIEARQLVDVYGQQAVGRALGRREYLAEQGKISKPAGFIKVATRPAWREINGFSQQAPTCEHIKPRKGRSTYKDPRKDKLCQSVSYRQWRATFFDFDDPLYVPHEMEIPF